MTEPTTIPRSVAIIMDGNGRWAKRRSFARIKGHEHGITAVRDCGGVSDRVQHRAAANGDDVTATIQIVQVDLRQNLFDTIRIVFDRLTPGDQQNVSNDLDFGALAQPTCEPRNMSARLGNGTLCDQQNFDGAKAAWTENVKQRLKIVAGNFFGRPQTMNEGHRKSDVQIQMFVLDRLLGGNLRTGNVRL